jgi:hypothetical protein
MTRTHPHPLAEPGHRSRGQGLGQGNGCPRNVAHKVPVDVQTPTPELSAALNNTHTERPKVELMEDSPDAAETLFLNPPLPHATFLKHGPASPTPRRTDPSSTCPRRPRAEAPADEPCNPRVAAIFKTNFMQK